MKNLFSWLKTLIISVVLYFLISTFFVNIILTFLFIKIPAYSFLYISTQIILFLIIFICVHRLLSTKVEAVPTVVVNTNVPQEYDPGFYTVYTIFLAIVTISLPLFSPAFSSNDLSGLIFFFSYPLMITGLIVTQLLKNKLVKTRGGSRAVKTFLIIVLILWTILLTLLYINFILAFFGISKK